MGGIDIKPGSFFGVDVVESSNLAKLLEQKRPDILVDFTVAEAAVQNAKTGAKAGTALVIGTTGFTPAQRAEMAAAIKGMFPR